jgi:hypothetical protein
LYAGPWEEEAFSALLDDAFLHSLDLDVRTLADVGPILDLNTGDFLSLER